MSNDRTLSHRAPQAMVEVTSFHKWVGIGRNGWTGGEGAHSERITSVW